MNQVDADTVSRSLALEIDFGLAGNGAAGNTGDGSPAIDAELHKPIYVRSMPDGSFVICDFNNSRIRAVNDQGIIGTVAGTGVSGFSGDGNLAVYAQGNRFTAVDVDGSGNMYVADQLNRRIRVIAPT